MDDQMALATGRVDESWLEQAYEAVRRTADLGVPFSANDVWDNGLEMPEQHAGARALGSQIAKLAYSEGYIKKTGAVVRSKKGVCYVDVWIKA
jgi:hypothetical protein